jgi:hypothetical protein
MGVTIVVGILVLAHTINPTLMPIHASELEAGYYPILAFWGFWAGINDAVDLIKNIRSID